MKQVLIVIIGLIIMFSIGYTAWNVKRTINYKFGYKGQVAAQVDKVMQEHIKKYHNGEIK